MDIATPKSKYRWHPSVIAVSPLPCLVPGLSRPGQHCHYGKPKAVSQEDDTRLPVVAVEVVGNDWHGKAGEERASEGTQHGDHLALDCFGDHVSIANCRHGDERPIDCRRHVDDSGRRPHLAVIEGDTEHDGTYHHEVHQKEHLRGARSQCHNQDPQTYVVLAELEQANHSENVEH